ncbi:MAG TPA: hypothetical protein VGG89_06370 [Candidatus Baltobacteraceae bacterium]|jgi:photosystem II stability/assembly factor-like uncharacterized protein
MHRLLSALLATLVALTAAPVSAAAASVSPSHLNALHWRLIGPFRGGREIAVTGVPGQPDHFYFGAVDGGVWETTDAGRTWNPIFDGQDIASIGAITVAPSNPSVIYVGSGEADMRSDIAYGNGVYKSTDGGKTWQHLGLDDSRQIGAIVVDPHDADVAYVAAGGHQYGPNAERGVFKTTDGGKTWSKVLYKDENTGAFSLAMDPSDPNVVYAGLWQTRRPPWNVYPPSNGPGSGLYKTTDGGKTWTQLHGGLPAKVGHMGLTISNAAPHRIYAMIDSDPANGGMWRSDDAGATWAHTDNEERIWQRGWYFCGITADPHNPDVVYAMNTTTYRSTDGGKSFNALIGDPTGPDFHIAWVDPNDSNRIILGSDQGVVVSVNYGKSWSSWYNQPTGQFYHVITDNAFPYWVYGAQQDSGAASTPSFSKYGSISQQDFRPLDVGGESGTLAPDPRHRDMVYGGTVTKEIPSTGWEQNIDPTLDYPGVVWRGTWTLPVAFSPVDPRTLYFGRQRIFRTRDGGKTWAIVSPDLSRSADGSSPNLDPATTADDNGVKRHGVVYSIAPSPLRADLIWAGTDDGYVWVTRDGGKRWSNVTPPAVTTWSKVGIIEASHFDESVAYAAVDRHRIDDYKPYIYRTRDGGRTWSPIARGIPDGSFVNAVREDPKRRGLLYAGTEKGVYVSFDDGDDWQPLQLNLPVTSIRDIAVHDDDVIVATHGRAFWVLDDVSTLRQLAAGASGATTLFAPALAYRVRPTNEEGTPLPVDEPQAKNAESGVYVDYYLADSASTVMLDVLDAGGRVIRHWSSAQPPKPVNPKSISFLPYWLPSRTVPSTTAGGHRFVWDFHRDSPDGPLVPPGRYTIRLSVNGRAYSRSAEVRRDPRAPATNADLDAQYALAMKIDALTRNVEAARTRAQKAHNPIAGQAPPDNPDDSVGSYSHDFTSLLYVDNSLQALQQAVESADAAPTPAMQSAFTKLEAIAKRAMGRVR